MLIVLILIVPLGTQARHGEGRNSYKSQCKAKVPVMTVTVIGGCHKSISYKISHIAAYRNQNADHVKPIKVGFSSNPVHFIGEVQMVQIKHCGTYTPEHNIVQQQVVNKYEHCRWKWALSRHSQQHWSHWSLNKSHMTVTQIQMILNKYRPVQVHDSLRYFSTHFWYAELMSPDNLVQLEKKILTEYL